MITNPHDLLLMYRMAWTPDRVVITSDSDLSDHRRRHESFAFANY